MIEEIKLAIENLNAELFLKLEPLPDYEEGSLEFIFRSDGNTVIVEFLRFDLWNSESDERDEYCIQCKGKNYEDPNECCARFSEYEPVEDFLRRKANKMLNMIKNLHFIEERDYYKV